MPRIGLYRSYRANMDEGWTRWILEQYEFPYTSLSNAEVRGDLSKFDVLLFADESEDTILNGHLGGTMPPDFVGGTRLDSGAWYVHTSKPNFASENFETPGEAASHAYGAYASVARDPYDVSLSFTEVQPAYDAAVGFTRRRNYRNWSPETSWAPRFSDHPLLRGVELGFDADVNLSLDNVLVDRNIRVTPMELEFHSGDSVEFQLFKQTEHLEEDFEIEDGIILPAGNHYDWWRYQVSADSAEHRVLSGRVEMSFGDFWDGDRRELKPITYGTLELS